MREEARLELRRIRREHQAAIATVTESVIAPLRATHQQQLNDFCARETDGAHVWGYQRAGFDALDNWHEENWWCSICGKRAMTNPETTARPAVGGGDGDR